MCKLACMNIPHIVCFTVETNGFLEQKVNLTGYRMPQPPTEG